MKKKRIILWSILACLCLGTPSYAQNKTYQKVAYDDCGNPEQQPHLVLGEDYEMPSGLNENKQVRTCNFGGKVIYAFNKLDINANYRMEVVFLADHDRVIRMSADGNPIAEDVVVPKGKEVRKTINLPRHSFAYGQFVVIFEALKGDNALVSEIQISSTNPTQLIAFQGDEKEALKKIRAYKVDSNVDVEKVLPQYAPFPSSVRGVYNSILSLNGVWEFSEKEQGNDWKPIQVPGQWNMQGFKVDSAAYARYKRTFTIPRDWNGKQVRLRFDGVHSEYFVYMNGKEIGYHLGGMTPYELNITKGLKEGLNELTLRVKSESLADMLGSLTQYAAHQLGGITRKVTLFAVPESYLSDLRIVTDLNKGYKDALLKVYTSVKNESGKKMTDLSLRITLDKHIASGTKRLPALDAGTTWSGWIEIPVAKPALWDNEHPNLYKLKVDLSHASHSVQQVEKQFGFREVEVKGNRVLVNGVPVKLRGVCRHEVNPLTGRSLSIEDWKRDAELYRDGNCNFVRTSHYPPAEEFIEYCDQLGLFVELEAPVCWVGHHANENWKKLNYRDSIYYDYILQADMETVHFYRNHPSVIFWSMANESYWNKEFAQVSEYMKKADPSRPYAFHDQGYGGFNNQGSTTPIVNIHYPGPGGYKVAEKSDRPMTYGEFCHLNVYNRSELVTDPGVRSDWALALAPMWENMYKTDGVLGGSIWSGIDDIFQLPNGDAVGYGAWGPIDGWRREKPEYWDMKKVYSPVKLLTSSLKPSGRLILEVENRYTFTNLNELRMSWSYGTESGLVNVNADPGKKGALAITIQRPEEANELSLTFIDPKGFVVDQYLIPVGEQVQNRLPDLLSAKTRLKTSNTAFEISGKEFSCLISKKDGQIISLKRQGKEMISGGPWLMALPLTGGGCYPNHNANTPIYNDLCKGWTVSAIGAKKENEDVLVNVAGRYQDFEGSYQIRVNANGELSVTYEFKSLIDVNPRQWGMVFETPQGFDKVFWRRDGLWNVYPNDHISRPVGEALSFYEEVPTHIDPRVKPTWAWSKDHNELGSNDFRSTRRNIWYAGLVNKSGAKVTVRSDGKQHWRSWVNKDKVCFLVADFVSPGDEMFLGGHYAPYRKPIKIGDKVNGTVTIRVE